MVTVWPIEGEVPVFDDEYCIAAQLALGINRHRVVGDDNFQCHPPMLCLVPRQPDSREAAGAELVHNSIAPIFVDVAQVNGMEAPWFVSLEVFSVVEAGEKETRPR